MTISASPLPTSSEGTSFPFGLRVLFRSIAGDGSLHYMIYPTARNARQLERDSYFFIIEDGNGQFLGLHHIDTISAINPLIPDPTPNAENSSNPA